MSVVNDAGAMRGVRYVRFETDALPAGSVEISRLEGRESIGALFEFELLAVYASAEGIEPEELLGREATLVFERDGAEVRRVHGMIAQVNDRIDTEADHTSYRFLFVPRAYRLTLVETVDVLLDISVPDIIRQKLTALGMKERSGGAARPGEGAPEEPHDFELRLYEKYPARELIVQYKESDLAFLSRLCEHLGISFFFEHKHGRDVMVFTDDNAGFRPIDGPAAVPFRPRGERTDVYRLEETTRLIPAQYVVRDYNYRTPQVSLTGMAEVPIGDGSVVEYGAHVKTPEEAEQMARIRAEERLAARRLFEGTSDLPALAAGATFTLDGHPRGDIDLLVTEARHRAALPTRLMGAGSGEPSGYTSEIKAIRKARRFRPPRVTPRPKIHGVVTGIIDAQEKSDYAKVDDQGRYLVRFVFDTHTPNERQASRWIRMAQPHAGPGYGMHFPLRPGVEVILTFVDGDPDRPIIAATVPNPQTASPVTSGNAPRNVIRTGSGNEINIDDTKDGQRIKLSTPKKNTTLQLGYRNAPEDGVALETQGAYSAVAVSGISHIGSFSASISAINKYLSGGRISSIAEKPGPLAGFLTAVELVKILTNTADTILGYVEFQRKERERELKKQSIEKQKTAVDAEKSRKEKQKKAAEALAKAKAKLADSSAVAQAEADYLAAQQQYEADLLLYRTNMEWLTEAKKGEWVPNEQTAAAPYTFGSAAQVEYYTGEVDTSKKAVYGDPGAQDADAQKGSKKRYEEARAAYLQALKDALAAEGLSDAEIAAATGEADEAIGDEGEADTVAQDTWSDADAAKNTYNTMTGVNELGDEAINVKKAKNTIEYLKAAEGLISEAVGAYTAVKELLELLKDQAQDLEAMTSAGLSFPREKAAILAGYDLKPKLINHTLGSEGDTVVYADNALTLRAPKAVLFGKDNAVVQSKSVLALLSRDKAELAASKKVLVTGGEVDILGDKEVKITASPRPSYPGLTGTITLESKNTTSVTSQKSDIALTAQTTLSGKAQDVQLHARQTAELLAGPVNNPNWGLKIDAQRGAVTLGNATSQWKLDIKDKNVALGGPQVGLAVTGLASKLHKGDANVTVAPNRISAQAVAVEIKGEQSVNISANGKVLLG